MEMEGLGPPEEWCRGQCLGNPSRLVLQPSDQLLCLLTWHRAVARAGVLCFGGDRASAPQIWPPVYPRGEERAS